MKKIFIPVVVILFLLNFKFTLGQTENSAQLSFDHRKYFLDQRKKQYSGSDTIEVEFRFRNTGSNPLLIESVSSSCSCTVPDYTKAPVKSGSTGIIKLTTSYDKLSVIKKVHAVIVANTKEKYYKLELFHSKDDDIKK